MTIGARGGVALVLNIKSVKKVVLRVKTFTRKQTLFKYSGLVLLSDLLEYAQTLFIVQLDFFLFYTFLNVGNLALCSVFSVLYTSVWSPCTMFPNVD